MTVANGALAKLPEMLAEMRAAPEVVRPSAFWDYHTELNLNQLEEDGFGEFKRTINRNYFQFELSNRAQYRAVLREWARRPHAAPLRARLADPVPAPPGTPRARAALDAKAYAVYLALLWEFVRGRDTAGLLEVLDEPLLGHPVYADYRGHRVSEDLSNSVLEFSAMIEGLGAAAAPPRSVIELGSGYGRVAWVFLSALPDVRYTLVDIPPALAIAEEYLTTLLPGVPAFGFRHFAAYEEVAAEFEAARLVFLTPNQLELIPPQGADLFVNISSLHEMRPDQIEHYFAAISRHCGGHFYSKQWQRSVNSFDDVVVGRGDYPVPPSWRVVFDRTHPVQVDFFEAMYRVTAS